MNHIKGHCGRLLSIIGDTIKLELINIVEIGNKYKSTHKWHKKLRREFDILGPDYQKELNYV